MAAQKEKNHLKKCCAHSRWTLSTCHLKRLWQTDMRGIWRLSYSQTAMTSYPALAPRSGRERIKASVAFTGRETSKDDFAWWDILVTTGVYVLLNCICDTVASKLGSEREGMLLLLLLVSFFFFRCVQHSSWCQICLKRQKLVDRVASGFPVRQDAG